jgi:DNA-binding NtrC family response regulator
LAPTDVSVMVTGESGTGKELVARALHHQGRRHRGRFVAINCAAMPETLLESELFGHARGAFTGATEDHVGLFVQADGGTLLLDEIGELSLGTQAKLLRALQERKVRPVGATREVAFDVRLVAATNRDLEAEVAAKRFRDDLFYRVNVVRITTPTLRARGDDILLLAQRFVERFAARYGSPVEGLAPAAVARLMGYRWPGNVRELENAMERAVALCRGHRIDVEDLPDEVVTPKRPVGPGGFVMDAEALEPLEALERRYILHVLDLTDGNKSRAAEILQVDRKTLYRKLERYGEAR